jgi:hypothetical protein
VHRQRSGDPCPHSKKNDAVLVAVSWPREQLVSVPAIEESSFMNINGAAHMANGGKRCDSNRLMKGGGCWLAARCRCVDLVWKKL